MTNQITLIVVLFALFSCQSKNTEKKVVVLPDYKPQFPTLDINKAAYLYEFAFHCIDQEKH